MFRTIGLQIFMEKYEYGYERRLIYLADSEAFPRIPVLTPCEYTRCGTTNGFMCLSQLSLIESSSISSFTMSIKRRFHLSATVIHALHGLVDSAYLQLAVTVVVTCFLNHVSRLSGSSKEL